MLLAHRLPLLLSDCSAYHSRLVFENRYKPRRTLFLLTLEHAPEGLQLRGPECFLPSYTRQAGYLPLEYFMMWDLSRCESQSSLVSHGTSKGQARTREQRNPLIQMKVHTNLPSSPLLLNSNLRLLSLFRNDDQGHERRARRLAWRFGGHTNSTSCTILTTLHTGLCRDQSSFLGGEEIGWSR